MYSYKLNNSYTVYVNYIYLNECIKAGKKSVQKEESKKQQCSKVKPTAASKSVKKCEPVKPSVPNSVKFGSTVRVVNTTTKQVCTWTLVHPDDINPAKQMLSVSSPVGKALIGHCVGDCVSVKIPAGMAQYKILDLKS